MKGRQLLCALAFISLGVGSGLAPQLDRRRALSTAFGSAAAAAASSTWIPGSPALAADDPAEGPFAFERRDRNGNKGALIREDYYFMMGKIPPRRLNPEQLPADDPAWNAWGTCTKSEATGNSCTYVSLKQRIPAYSKYAFSIGLGASDFGRLRGLLEAAARDGSVASWAKAAAYVSPGTDKQSMPSPLVDSLLKLILFATSMLTSPNYSGPSRELLVTRFYANEAAFAVSEIRSSIERRDSDRALAAWDYGKDSFNSYFVILNRAITPKVGDKFTLIE